MVLSTKIITFDYEWNERRSQKEGSQKRYRKKRETENEAKRGNSAERFHFSTPPQLTDICMHNELGPGGRKRVRFVELLLLCCCTGAWKLHSSLLLKGTSVVSLRRLAVVTMYCMDNAEKLCTGYNIIVLSTCVHTVMAYCTYCIQHVS